MTSAVFTDNQLAQLFLGFQRDFKEKQEQGESVEKIVDHLGEKLYWSLQNGHLRTLDWSERHKAYQVLDTVIQSTPAYKKLPKQKQKFTIKTSYSATTVEHHHYHHGYYCNHSDPWLTWLVLSSMSRPHYHHGHHYGGWGHHHHGGRHSDKKDGDALAMLFLVLIVGALILSAFILSYYTLKEILDCGDRFFHNEGMLRALTSMAIMAASATAGALIGSLLLAGPLAALALAAGTGPVGVIVVASVALAMIGAGLSALLINKFKAQEHFIKGMNKDAIDPAEPQRFSLTRRQERKLQDMGLDIVKVKCAMVAIRSQMDAEHVHSKFTRMFSSKGKEHQQLLKQLRDLKDGQFTYDIRVGDLTIDLRAPAPQSSYYYQQPPMGQQYEPQPFVVQPQPSAPPMEPSDYHQYYPTKDGFHGGTPAPTFYQQPQYEQPPVYQDPRSMSEDPRVREQAYPTIYPVPDQYGYQ
jgi:hypothetical protein